MSLTKPSLTKEEQPSQPGTSELVQQYLSINRLRKRPSATFSRGRITPISFHHTAADAGLSPRRPLPRDANVPEGFERLPSGTIVPQRPVRPEGRYEGQRDDDTMAEHLVRRSIEHRRFLFILSAVILIAMNLSIGIVNVTGRGDIPPIGLIPIPLVFAALISVWRAEGKLWDMKREREDVEIARVVGPDLALIDPYTGEPYEEDIVQGLGTVTVSR